MLASQRALAESPSNEALLILSMPPVSNIRLQQAVHIPTRQKALPSSL